MFVSQQQINQIRRFFSTTQTPDSVITPYQSNNATYYYSEKNFSLGELCVLRLASRLENIDANSLILIDEIEMALHPQAQVRLLEMIQIICRQNNLTVLFSTHSATLIKNIDRSNIIFLKESTRGRFQSTRDVYPAQVLGDIAFDDELNTDYIFYVEDKQAKILLEQLIAMYFDVCDRSSEYAPLYKIVPVGGFVQVIEMLTTSTQIFPSYVKRHAILDDDVRTHSLEEARRTNNRALLDLYDSSSDNIKFLPCTPEQGLMELFEGTDDAAIDSINQSFQGARLNIRRIVSTPAYQELNRTNIRSRAKDRVKHIVAKIHELTGCDKAIIYKTLYGNYCKNRYSNSESDLHRMFGPIFNSR